jgi:asparagine synthase (glutamine-hydrolysing)
VIAAVVDACPERHARTVDTLLRFGGMDAERSFAEDVTLVAWGRPHRAKLDLAVGVASVGDLGVAIAGIEPEHLRDLRGDFALVARCAGRVRLARGHFGGRALYFTAPHPSRSLVVCSRLGPLLATLDRAATIDRLRMAMLMAGVADTHSAERSPFAEVRRVRSGDIVEVQSNGSSKVDSLPLPKAIDLETAQPEDVASELRARLMKIVARQVAGQDRVAIMASGGVDSSAVLSATVAHARAFGRPSIEVLTVDAAGPGDDRPYFAILCRELGVTPLRFTAAQCAPYMRPAWTLDATPCTWLNGAWEWPLLEAARARGAEVVLTGAGGDDLFEGDPRLLAQKARRGNVLGALVAALRLRAYSQPTAWGRLRDFVLRPLITPWIPRRLRSARLRRIARSLPHWTTRFARDAVEHAYSVPEAPPEDGQHFIAALATAPHLMDPVDARTRIEAATGCLIRDPLFAPELVEVVASIPMQMLLHGDRLRGLFRLAMRGLVPDVVRLRPDKASFEPTLTEMLSAAGGLTSLRDLAMPRALADLGLVRPDVFAKAFAAAESRAGPSSWSSWAPLWPVLALEAFVRAHEQDLWRRPT